MGESETVPGGLRERAERAIESGEVRPGSIAVTPEKLIHELQVHQAELEIQNEELIRSRLALEISEARWRALFQNAPVPYVVTGPDGMILEANGAAMHLAGQGRPLTGMAVSRLAVDEDQIPLHRVLAQVFAARSSQRVEVRLRGPGGTAIPVEVVAGPLHESEGVRALVQLVDVRERRRAEAAIRESEARYRGLVETFAAGVVVHGPDGRVAFANGLAAELLGVSAGALVGQGPELAGCAFVHEDGTPMPAAAYPAVRARETGAPVANVVAGILRPPSSDLTWVLVSARPVLRAAGELSEVVVTFVDISRLKAAEKEIQRYQEQLAVASRLVAMGTLVAGVAHEVNSPLSVTLSGQKLALREVRALAAAVRTGNPVDAEEMLRVLAEVEEEMEDALAGSERVARIVKDLTSFSRPDPTRTRVALASVVADAMRWFPAVVAERAMVTLAGEGAPEVEACAGQLEQVVVNLVTNAAKAIPDARRGQIVITCAKGSAGRAYIEVADDGTGIDPQVMPRIFDPFFTTRPVGEGKGIGLGLSICHAIVTAHGGTLTVTSELGKGATFRLELPAASGA